MTAPGELEVLHALRVRGVCGLELLSVQLDVDPEQLRWALVTLRRRELVSLQAGSLPGWALTTIGRDHGEALLSEELDSLGARSALEASYDRFLELNPQVLAVCTDWQIVAGTEPMQLNDHADPDYDAAVLSRLEGLHRRAEGVLGEVVERLARFGPYRPRLANALARARRGGVDWVTRPMIDSYHTVWFELHEDLLATLGRRRGDDARRDTTPHRPATIDRGATRTDETPTR